MHIIEKEFHKAKYIINILILAIVYILSGKAALTLAIPPGYATAIFPAAGIAIAALARFGRSVWPGIFLGSLCLNLWLGMEHGELNLNSTIIAFVAASGASLQALLAYYLCRKIFKTDLLLIKPKEIFSFMLLAGPIACLINASMTPLALYLLGAIRPDKFLYTAFTWWAGDCVGVLLFAPIVFCFLYPKHTVWQSRRYYVAFPLLIILSVTIILFIWLSHWEQTQINYQFKDVSQRFVKKLQTQIALNLSDLSAIERFFISSNYIDVDEFHNFTLKMIQTNKSLNGLSWDPVILEKNRQNFIDKTRQESFPDFNIKEKNAAGVMVNAKERPYYVVVKYIEPYASHKVAQGFDVLSEPSREKALLLSKVDKTPIATSTIKFIQTKTDEKGFLIFYPVFKHDHQQQYEGDGQLLGFIVGIYSIPQLLNATLASGEFPFSILLEDITTHPKEPIYIHDPINKSNVNSISYQKIIDIAGRQWHLSLWPNKQYMEQLITWQAWSITLGNLIFCALFTAMLLILTGNAYSLDKSIQEKTIDLKMNNAFIEEISRIQSLYLEHADIEWILSNLLCLITNTFKAKHSFISFYPNSPVLKSHCYIYDAQKKFLLRTDETSQPHTITDVLQFENKMDLNGDDFAFRGIKKDKSMVARIGFYDALGSAPTDIEHHFNVIESLLKTILHSHENLINIENLAITDSLTGLYNRFYFKEVINKLINENRSNPHFKFCIMLIDFNEFKAINDYYGHHYGDELLKLFAKRVKKQIKSYDVLARVGGDEFILMVKNLEDFSCSGKVADRIFKEAKQPYNIHGNTIKAHISIGISCFPESGTNYEELLKHADLALYEVKRSKQAYAYFSENLQLNFLRQISLEQEIEKALKAENFSFIYQPQYHIDGKEIVGYESLIRWPTGKEENKSPGVFIAALERMGKSKELNEYVVRKVLNELNLYNIGSPIKISINISPQVYKFSEHIMMLAELATKLNLNPNVKIAFEITESKLVNVSQYFNKNSKEANFLREKNIILALDDFGVSYSSLNRLLEYDFSILKIDLSFIQKIIIEEHKDSIHLVKAMIDIGAGLGIDVIAEGVETLEQIEVLKNLGCHYIQGYFYGKPESADIHFQKKSLLNE